MKHTKCHSQVSELTKCLQRNQSHKCICYYGTVEHHSTPPKDLLQNGVAENIECVLCVCRIYLFQYVCHYLILLVCRGLLVWACLWSISSAAPPLCLHTLSRVQGELLYCRVVGTVTLLFSSISRWTELLLCYLSILFLLLPSLVLSI